MKLAKLFLAIIMLSQLCCFREREQSITTINANPEKSDSLFLSQITTGVDKIILETNDSSLITTITEVEITKGYVFVNDATKRVLQFDMSGNFIRQIGKEGRGPGEYNGIISIAADSLNRKLYIDTFRQIICFDFSGKLADVIWQKSIPEYIEIVGNQLWAVSTSLANKVDKGGYVNITKLDRYSLQGEMIDTITVCKVYIAGETGTISPTSYIISDIGRCQFLYNPVLLPEPILRDTIYEVNGKKLIPSAKIDFGNIAKPLNGKKQIYLQNIFRSDRFLFAEFKYKKTNKLLCHDYTEEKTFFPGEGFIDDFYKTGKVQLRPLDLKTGTVYFIKDAVDLSGKIDRISESSNPVIFIVHLKGNF